MSARRGAGGDVLQSRSGATDELGAARRGAGGRPISAARQRNVLAWLLTALFGVASAAAETPTLRLRSLPGAEQDASLETRLCHARARLELAQRENVRASAAYRRMRRDDYPRGDPRELIKQWRIRTRAELGDAESDFAELSEAASWKIDVEDALEACDAPEPAPE